jgi:hypothetical protein
MIFVSQFLPMVWFVHFVYLATSHLKCRLKLLFNGLHYGAICDGFVIVITITDGWKALQLSYSRFNAPIYSKVDIGGWPCDDNTLIAYSLSDCTLI